MSGESAGAHGFSQTRQSRRRVAQVAAATGSAFLLKAGRTPNSPLALARADDISGRGNSQGGDRSRDSDSADEAAEEAAKAQEEAAEEAAETAEEAAEEGGTLAQIARGSLEVRIVGDDAGDFVPGELTVDVGQSVTFVNVHSDEHTATGSGFDTGIIPDEGGSATVLLDTPGVFPYACLIHPEMTGVIRVRDENGVVPETQTASQAIPADATTVVIANLAFDPAAITVPTGTTVAWTNDDSVPHTVTSTDGAFDSGIFDPGGSFAFTFNEPGAFPYVCQLHPQMQGTVTAEGEPVAGGEQAAQPASAQAATPAPAEAPSQATPSGTSVSIVDFAFEPATLQVASGHTVTWTNDGLSPHTVTGDFADSGVLDPGQTFSHTFEVEGAFDYFCAIHPEMVGSVEVDAVQAPPASPVAAANQETAGPEGVWLLELVPDNDGILGAQRALIAFHASGMLEVDFAAAPGDAVPTNLLASGHGEWVVRDARWNIALAALMNDADQRFAATVTFDGEGQLSADGTALEGTFTFDVVETNGQSIGQGSGTFSGQPVPLDP